MAPSGLMTAIPPTPPDISAQGQPQVAPPGASPASFANMGPSLPNPVSLLKAQMQKLEQWAAETKPLLTQVDQSLGALMVPIAQAGLAMQSEIDQIEQRNAGPSPTVTGTNPPNLPGNIPGAESVMQ
jgi:hypothetical protein